MYVLAGRPAFARTCERVHRSISLMSSSLLLQQCPACLDSFRAGWYVAVQLLFFFGGGCLQDLLDISCSIHV